MANAEPEMRAAAPMLNSFIGRPLKFFWGLFADVAIFFITVWWAGLCIVTTLITRQAWPVDIFGRIWCRWILKVCGIHLDVEGLENIDRSKSYVIMSNHLSNFDIWATASLSLKIRFIAKKELLKVPVFGQALALSDHIVIDRSNPEEAIERINAQAARRIREGFCILFYAEGTRSPDGKVHEFKKGGVTLALRTGLPIVPLSVSGTRKFLPKGRLIIRPSGRVKIVLDKPIDTTRYRLEQRDELNQLVRSIVVKNYVENY